MLVSNSSSGKKSSALPDPDGEHVRTLYSVTSDTEAMAPSPRFRSVNESGTALVSGAESVK